MKYFYYKNENSLCCTKIDGFLDFLPVKFPQ